MSVRTTPPQSLTFISMEEKCTFCGINKYDHEFQLRFRLGWLVCNKCTDREKLAKMEWGITKEQLKYIRSTLTVTRSSGKREHDWELYPGYLGFVGIFDVLSNDFIITVKKKNSNLIKDISMIELTENI